MENSFWQEGYNFTENNNNYSIINIYDTLISLDSQAPEINLISPANNSNSNAGNVTFSCNSTDLSLKNITFSLYSTSALINQTFEQISGSFKYFEINITNLSDGSYVWSCSFRDEGNNLATRNYSLSIEFVNESLSFVAPTESVSATSRSYILINVSANETSLENITLRLYNSTYSQINSTNSTTSPLFANFSNLTEQAYYFNATACYSNGNCTSSATRSMILDTTIPTISLTSPADDTSQTSSTASFTFNVSDANEISNCTLRFGSSSYLNQSYINRSTTNTISVSSISNGNYTWNVNCTDIANNKVSSSARDFTKTSSTSTSSSSTTSSGSSTASENPAYNSYAITYAEAIKGTSKELVVNDRAYVSLSYNGRKETHLISPYKIGGNYVNIVVRSNPIYVNLTVGESKKLSINSTSIYNLLLKLNSINNNKANITIQAINETIVAQQNLTITGQALSNITSEEKQASAGEFEFNIYYIIFTFIFLLILAFIIQMLIFKMKKGKKHKYWRIMPLLNKHDRNKKDAKDKTEKKKIHNH
jgi:hypothetical protein